MASAHWSADAVVAIWPNSLKNPDGSVATQVQLEHLLNQCELVYKFAGVDTQWISGSGSARCAIEQLALDIFKYHIAGLPSEWSLEESGAEWWVQVSVSCSRDSFSCFDVYEF